VIEFTSGLIGVGKIAPGASVTGSLAIRSHWDALRSNWFHDHSPWLKRCSAIVCRLKVGEVVTHWA